MPVPYLYFNVGGKPINWPHWRKEFVQGGDEITLTALSKRPHSPALQTFKNKSAEENWDEQRKRYRRELESRGAYDSAKDEIKPEIAAAIDRTEKIIDTAEMLTQHNAIAKALIGIGAAGIKEFQLNNFAKAKQMKPRELLEFAKFGIEMQRIIEGMATSKTEIDFKGMSDAELNAIIDGDV